MENGLGDFSFDWALVQSRVSRFTRICTYDRAGYAWSDPGPMPRSYAQLNRELSDGLAKLGEKGPFVLVGHSYGGPVVRNFAATYPTNVAGLVLVDSVFEDQRVPIQGRAIRLRDGAKGTPIPPPREDMRPSDTPAGSAAAGTPHPLDALYERLPPAEQAYHRWAQEQTAIDAAENSQREWSTESLARMAATPQDGTLGALPLVVLMRERGGYSNKLDVPAERLDEERKTGQAGLARLSRNSRLTVLPFGHNMHIEAPDEVAAAIGDVVRAVRDRRPIGRTERNASVRSSGVVAGFATLPALRKEP
ncbi:MAG: alpha/beta hydrolase [Acidobacteriota bacterium]